MNSNIGQDIWYVWPVPSAAVRGWGIPLYWRRERTIGRFHPIAQKQKTDLNIPRVIGQSGSRDAKTKAARKSGCRIDLSGGEWSSRQQPGQRVSASGTWPRRNPGLAGAEPRLKPRLGPSAAPSPPPLHRQHGCLPGTALYNVFSIPAPIQRTFPLREFYFDLIHRTKKFNLSCCYLGGIPPIQSKWR